METQEAKILRALYHLERTSIGSFPLGRGAIRGRVRGKGALRSPLSGRECVGYALSVQNYLDLWTAGNIYYEGVCEDFQVQDDESVAWVQGRGASLALNKPVVVATAMGPLDVRYILHPRGLSGPLPHWQIRETIVTADDRVVVCGHGRQVPDPTAGSAGYRSAPKTRLELHATHSFPLLISNCAAIMEASHEAVEPTLIS